MRREATRDRITAFMKELARRAPRTGSFDVYLVGGGTAVFLGWRPSSVDVDVYSDKDAVFQDIQKIKEDLEINVEFARPEHFVPPLKGSTGRHVFIDTMGPVTFFHYDPYAQVLSKVVRGFKRDLDDARQFIRTGMVDPDKLRSLTAAIPDSAYARYPALSRTAIEHAVEGFLDTL
ncbi:MAG: DUF6036 family nucleotidyltransferase [Rhodothermales bacterium]